MITFGVDNGITIDGLTEPSFTEGMAVRCEVGQYTYYIMGDGCLQEDIFHESRAYTGHTGLEGFAFWVDKGITIYCRIELSFTEDVALRYEVDPATKTRKRYAELANGRLTMAAILGLQL